MASPRKSTDDKQAPSAQRQQETGESSGAASGEQQQTESVTVTVTVPVIPSPPPPLPTQQVQGRRDTTTAAPAAAAVISFTGTRTVEVPPPSFTRMNFTSIFPQTTGGAGPSSGGVGERRPKRKGELVEVPSGPPVCYVCNRGFRSWKAVFGHMRSHKIGEERLRPGVFPPPSFMRVGSPEKEEEYLHQQLAPALFNIAQEVLTRAQNTSSSSSSSSSTVSARPHIDLNVAQMPLSPSQSMEAELERSSPSAVGIDLNKPPRNGEDDDAGDT